MFNLSFSTSLTAPVATGKPGAPPAGGVFALSLAAPIVPGVAGSVAATDAAVSRQPLAADGNPLPTPLAATPDVEPADAALAWLIAPQPDAASAGSPLSAAPTEAGVDAVPTLPAAAAIVALAPPPQADPAPAVRPKRKADDAAAPDQAAALLRPASDLVLPQIVAPPAIVLAAPAPDQPPDGAPASASAAPVAPSASVSTPPLPIPLTGQPASDMASVAKDVSARPAPVVVAQAPTSPAPAPDQLANDSTPMAADAQLRPAQVVLPQALPLPTDLRAQGGGGSASIARGTVATPALPTSASPTPAAAPLIGGRPIMPAPVSNSGLVPSPLPAADAAPTLVDGRQIAVRDRGAAATGNAAPTPAVAAAAVQAASSPPSAPVVQAASMLFGIALSPALRPGERDNAGGASPRDAALQALTAAAGSAQVVGAVVAPDSAQQSSLDMRRHDWPQTMIDHIEALRDAADAVSTRITLMPDALGRVDVSLRHDGDTVHVHFAAEAAQTRAMLADAQPRLTEAAQARGIRIGQATVDAGQGGGGQQPRHQATTPAVPQAPRPASTLSTDPDGDPDSSRLA